MIIYGDLIIYIYDYIYYGYVSHQREAVRILDVHYNTIFNMTKEGRIEYVKVGSKFKYNIDKYMRENSMEKEDKKNICYCRVSSIKQADELKKQKDYMKEKYPDYEIITDIGSGLNFNRKGLEKILILALEGKIREIRVTYKDRLARFGYELIEWLVTKNSNGKIIIENNEEPVTPQEEIVKDMSSIMKVYEDKIHRLKKFMKEIKKEILEHKLNNVSV